MKNKIASNKSGAAGYQYIHEYLYEMKVYDNILNILVITIILEIIKEIRLKLPEELKQAKVIKEEHDRIISKANEEAAEIVKEAENRIISMIDEHEITKKAYEQKNKIIENANDMAREISNGTKAYADSILAGVQVTLEDALKVIENNRKEVK